MLSYAQYSDLELADLFNKKDEGAFSEIYDRYWAILYRHGRRMLQNDEEAKDLTQEVFLTLLDKSEELELTTILSGYLYKISRNKILNRIDHDKVRDKYKMFLSDAISLLFNRIWSFIMKIGNTFSID